VIVNDATGVMIMAATDPVIRIQVGGFFLCCLCLLTWTGRDSNPRYHGG